jgi:hypothetical protein
MSSVSRSVSRPVSRSILAGQSNTLASIIKSLFANNEQGFAYDPNDLSTMFQDAAGTVPVTVVGQPVGLVLDKSKGLVLGSEKWIDSKVTFTGGAARISPNVYRIYSPDSSYSGVGVPVALTVGRLYKLTFNVDSITLLGGGVSSEGTPTTIFTTTGQKSIYFFATATTAVIKRASTSCDIQISNISVKEILGNHAYQTTSASRPILQRNATTGAYYLAFDGTDDFLVTNNIDFTATDQLSLFAGVRKLSDVGTGIVAELSTQSAANAGTFRITAPNATGVGNYGAVIGGTVFASAAVTAAAPSSNIITLLSEITPASFKIRLNGAIAAQASSNQGTGNYGNYPLYIGRRAGTTLQFNGHLYGLIGIGRLTTDSETAVLEKSIAKSTGVTLNV